MVADKTSSDKYLLTDEAALIQAARKDPLQFKPIYEHYHAAIFRFVFHKVTDRQTAADITSQVFLKALLKLSAYENKGFPFSAWLYRIAHNESMQYFRQHQQIRKVVIDEAMLEELAEEADTTNVEVLRHKLAEAIQQLSLQEIQLIELRFYEHKSFREMAYILSITENNAKVKTYRLLEKIKKMMTCQNPII